MQIQPVTSTEAVIATGAEPAGLAALPRECRHLVRTYLTATEVLRHFLSLENLRIFVGGEQIVLHDKEQQAKRGNLLEAYHRAAETVITMIRLGLMQDVQEVRKGIERESRRLRCVMQQNEALYLTCIQNINARVDTIMRRIDGELPCTSNDEGGERYVTH